MDKINKYQALCQSLTAEIESGKLKPNDRLPSENDLAEAYNISRVTVRKALEELEKQGYLTRIQGKGNFVSDTLINKKLNEIVSFTRSSLLRGELPSTIVKVIEEIKPTPYLMKNLRVSADEPLIHIQRVRYTNDFPLIYEDSFWIKSIVGEISKEAASDSLFHWLKAKNIIPSNAVQELDAISAGTELAEQLQVNPGFPLLRSLMIFYDQQNRPFELAFNYHRTDRCKLSLIRKLSE